MASGDEAKEQLILPNVSTTKRNLMAADVGTIIYDVTQSKICFAKSEAIAAASWETSA